LDGTGSGAVEQTHRGSQHGSRCWRIFSAHRNNGLTKLVATRKQTSQVVGLRPTDSGVVVRVDGDVNEAEAERLELPCSVCSACGIDWTQVTAITNVRRYVSRDHEECSDLDNVRMKTMGLLSAVFAQSSGSKDFVAIS
jgi:hypothetical protein